MITAPTDDDAYVFFELKATAHNCVITNFDLENHIVEFNGADEDLEALAIDLAKYFE